MQPFLVGFSTKDLSLSFLSGKAALRDVEVNVEAVNEKLSEIPGVTRCSRALLFYSKCIPPQIPVRLTRVYVSELSVRVSPSKIKSKPIRLIIDEVYQYIVIMHANLQLYLVVNYEDISLLFKS